MQMLFLNETTRSNATSPETFASGAAASHFTLSATGISGLSISSVSATSGSSTATVTLSHTGTTIPAGASIAVTVAAAAHSGLIASMQRDKDRMDSLLQAALDMASEAFAEAPAQDKAFVVAGESNLLDISEDTETVRGLFEAFSQKGSILHLLDRCLNTEGIQLFIGEESGYNVLDELSLVSSSYSVNGRIAGVLGVVGPTRMAYQRVIPVVEVTAHLLGDVLQHP